MIRIFSALTTCLLTVGCSALNVQRPTAAVTGMTVQNVTAAGFTMNFGVNLTNPNAVALPLSGADYKLAVGGVGVADGRATPDEILPANGTAAVSVPVAVTFESLLAAERSIVGGGGNVPYALDGGLSFGTKNPLLGDVRVPIASTGTLPLRDVLNNPQAVAQSPAARQLAQALLGNLFGR